MSNDNIRDLFNRLLDAKPADRAAILDRECEHNPALGARLEAMLAAAETPDQFLASREGDPRRAAHAVSGFHTDPRAAHEVSSPNPAPSTIPSAPIELPGSLIGRYKLLQKIGEGGFGAVFLAEQREPVARKVALKIIKLGMDTRQVIARFEAERQALAMMDHPNIAKVLDGGATDTGRPYFVMELVKGVPITEYADTNNLTTRERLELFIPVCRAVQHAHQKGIIHRDIKPGNVLVTLHDGTPVPKVIDFGIAKATDHRLTEKTVFTEFRQLIGTPEYMSPEQAEMSGLDVDTRSDVYSLGVLLYELLTGTTPFDGQQLRSKAYAEIQRIIREIDPPRPSLRISTLGGEGDGKALTTVAAHRRIDPDKLSRQVKGDLDWIVMRCLEKDRTRRYGTASDLAADVSRHLGGEAVEAAPPSVGYRVRKFVRRNRGAVGAGSVVCLVLAAGIVATTWQAYLAERQRSLAEAVSHRLRADHADAAESMESILNTLFWEREQGPQPPNPTLTDEATGELKERERLARLLDSQATPKERAACVRDIYISYAGQLEGDDLAMTIFWVAQQLACTGRFRDACAVYRQLPRDLQEESLVRSMAMFFQFEALDRLSPFDNGPAIAPLSAEQLIQEIDAARVVRPLDDLRTMLALAQYRVGIWDAALKHVPDREDQSTRTGDELQAEELENLRLAVLTMIQFRLGQTDNARQTLAELRQRTATTTNLNKRMRQTHYRAVRAVVDEAEMLVDPDGARPVQRLAKQAARLAADLVSSNTELVKERDSARWSAHTANIALVQSALAARNYHDARRLLSSIPEARRGWEWHLLNREAQAICFSARGLFSDAWITREGQIVAIEHLSNRTLAWDLETGDPVIPPAAQEVPDDVQAIAGTWWSSHPRRHPNFAPVELVRRISPAVQDHELRDWFASPDGTLVANTSWEDVRVFDCKTGACVAWFDDLGQYVSSAGISRDNTKAIILTHAGEGSAIDVRLTVANLREATKPARLIRPGIVDVEAQVAELLYVADDAVDNPKSRPNGPQIEKGNARTMRFLDPTTHREVAVFRMEHTVMAIQGAGDGARFAMSLANGDAVVWDIRDPSERRQDWQLRHAERTPANAYLDTLWDGQTPTDKLHQTIIDDPSLSARRRLVAVELNHQRLADFEAEVVRRFEQVKRDYIAPARVLAAVQSASNTSGSDRRMSDRLLVHATKWRPDFEDACQLIWSVVRVPGASDNTLEVASEVLKSELQRLQGAAAYARVRANRVLALVEYRRGNFEGALMCESVVTQMGKPDNPLDLLILAMTHWQYPGRDDYKLLAKEELSDARSMFADPANADSWARNADAKSLLAEAESLIDPKPVPQPDPPSQSQPK